MIDALVTGKVHAAPVVRQSKAGRDFITVTLRVALSAENEAVFAHVVAFSDSACQALRALAVGDGVSVAGRLTPGAWLDKEGKPRPSVDVVADQVLSVYSIRKKRAAVQAQPSGPLAQPSSQPAQLAGQREEGLRRLEAVRGQMARQRRLVHDGFEDSGLF